MSPRQVDILEAMLSTASDDPYLLSDLDPQPTADEVAAVCDQTISWANQEVDDDYELVSYDWPYLVGDDGRGVVECPCCSASLCSAEEGVILELWDGERRTTLTKGAALIDTDDEVVRAELYVGVKCAACGGALTRFLS